MGDKETFDLQSANQYFSANCFNHAWDFIEKESRTPQEEEEMLHLSLTSLWHWTQRSDRKGKNLAVAYWQAARVFTLIKNAEMAVRYAKRCYDITHENQLAPFHLGFACEALARAFSLAGSRGEAEAYLQQAHTLAQQVTDPEDKETLEKDLRTIQLPSY